MNLYIFNTETAIIFSTIISLWALKEILHFSVMFLKCPKCSRRFTLRKKYSSGKILKKNENIEKKGTKILDSIDMIKSNSIYCKSCQHSFNLEA